jgi:hypothetical protein
MITILIGVRGNLTVVLFAFPLWPGIVRIFSYVFWTSSFKKFCLVQLPSSLLVH